MEFLAEKDGVGCEPRTEADYAAMRGIIDHLDADVIAFQEVENLAAAARVFDPARYDVIMEQRPGAPSGTCGGKNAAQSVIRQAVGFAVRKGIAFDRYPDVTSLMLGNAQLRSGVDITLRPRGRAPVRLLSIHLKSGCFAGSEAKACSVLTQQMPMLEAWIDTAAAGPDRFIILGDWNRRLGLAGDSVWAEIDDGEPANADLRLADEGIQPECDPRYTSFIDHIVLDRRAGGDMQGFIAQHTYWCVGRGLADARGNGKTLLRLRIVMDEGGWTLTPGALVGAPPVATPDRLKTAYSLLQECGRL